MSKRASATLVGLIEVAALGLAIFSIATLFGELHRYLELFSHFRAQYFVAAIFLLLVFGILRRRNIALLLLALVILNATFVVPWYLGEDQPGASGQEITLLQANVLARNGQTGALMSQIDQVQPDIVVIQEMSADWLETMLQRADEYPYHVAEPRDGAFGIGMFSKIPLADERIVRAPPIDLPEVRAVLKTAGGDIYFASAHPMPPIGKAGVEARNTQLQALGAALGAMTRPTILMGDLNISMWAPTYRAFEEASNLRNARKGFGLVPTFPVFLPIAGIPIDHVLVSDEIAVLEFRQGERTGSDHWPIIVRLRLPDQDNEAALSGL